MPQTFHVLSCVNCKKFQNHIVKQASDKWTCKICNKKQTFLKAYGEGTGAECRKIVQTLNFASGELEEESVSIAKAIVNFANGSGDTSKPNQGSTGGFTSAASLLTSSRAAQPKPAGSIFVPPEPSNSKWNKYKEDPDN